MAKKRYGLAAAKGIRFKTTPRRGTRSSDVQQAIAGLAAVQRTLDRVTGTTPAGRMRMVANQAAAMGRLRQTRNTAASRIQRAFRARRKRRRLSRFFS